MSTLPASPAVTPVNPADHRLGDDIRANPDLVGRVLHFGAC